MLAPGHKVHAAAVSEADVVTADEPPGWHAFLQQDDAKHLLRQIGWLHGMWIGLAPGERVVQGALRTAPALALHLQPPSVTRDSEATVFVGWYCEPPAMVSFRFRVTAGPGGVAFERERPHR